MIISFTGAQSTGKSTLLNFCKEEFGDKFVYFPEITRQIRAECGVTINEAGNNVTQTLIVAEHIKNMLKASQRDSILDRCILDGMVRVKYLDSSDIESLGFKKSNKNSWFGYKDYFLENINPEYPYFLFATIHVPIRGDMYKILVHRYYNEDESIDEDDNYREPTCVYVGKIKNKSELSQLLKRLNIINE